jgi:pyruvate dehydrogenase E2 component (dihydrolipoamide acetyltransferase)
MATQVILPKLGNSVESSIIASWLKQPGDAVAEGDALCLVETDKTTMEVASTAAGVLLQHLAQPGDDVPVHAPIAWIGAAGEALPAPATIAATESPASPRARKLAAAHGVDVSKIEGSGPNGRIIERDVRAAAQQLTPLAKAMVASGDYVAPEQGSGFGGRITRRDLVDARATSAQATGAPINGVRRIIAERMRASLQNTAQLTMHASADARALLGYRQRLKASDERLGLREITINDLVMLVTAKTLAGFPELNATLQDGVLTRYDAVHLAFAVDAPRGLLVPVIRDAQTLTLRQLAEAARTLGAAARDNKLSADQLSGGTFTVSNLGQFGIESFTPILNAPQVAILGVGNVNLKPVEQDGEIAFVPHLGLSLTIDHQALDGAPGAKFLQTLARNIAQIELLLAM